MRFSFRSLVFRVFGARVRVLPNVVVSSETGEPKKQNPRFLSEPGVHQLWQCPTLAQPIDALPSGLQRFTSVFGMGTGGATALGSPEGW
jgi:hypothetical protein